MTEPVMKNSNAGGRENLTKRLLNAGKVKQFRRSFLELHPTDQAEIFLTLSIGERKKLYKYVSPEEFAEIFQGLELNMQMEIFKELDEQFAVEMFNEMYSDDAADFLAELPQETSRSFLDNMKADEAEEVRNLLAHPEETAGSIMTTEYVAVESRLTVSEAMAMLREECPEAETIYYIYVVDNDKLVGVVSLRDLLTAPLDKKIEDIMYKRVVSVPVTTDQEAVADVIKKYDFLAVPVVNQEKELVGIITVDDIIDVLEVEASEDIGEITAARGTVDLDLPALHSVRLRLPWLVMLIFIGLITAGIVSRFEETLEAAAILAAFMPVIAATAGNTGTQSLAVIVRGLALGKIDKVTVLKLLKRELITGILMGIACGGLLALISQVVTGGNLVLGFVIGFSLFVTLIVATLTGTIIPLIIDLLNIDPAVASGPFITTINDIIALTIYFSIATALLDML